MYIGGIAGVVYYLLVSFTYPNMQMDQAGFDLKYDPTYIVIMMQCKLLIAGIGSFFPDEGDIMMQISTQAFVLIILALYILKAKPCKVYSWNIIDFGLYMLGAWICIVTVILHSSGEKAVGWICLLLGLIVFGFVSLHSYFNSRRAEVECDQIFKAWIGQTNVDGKDKDKIRIERNKYRDKIKESRQIKSQKRR